MFLGEISRLPQYNKICIGCKKEFVTRRDDAKYCVQTCYWKYMKPVNGFKSGLKPWNIGRKMSYEERLKVSKNSQEMWANFPEEVKKKLLSNLEKGRPLGNGGLTKGKDRDQTNHLIMISKECARLEEQGFRVIPIVKAIPDIIAIKDGKVYAIECETYGNPAYKKYVGIDYFDDIIWIVGRRQLKKNMEES
jgi:hypothetical protein